VSPTKQDVAATNALDKVIRQMSTEAYGKHLASFIAYADAARFKEEDTEIWERISAKLLEDLQR